MLMLIVLSACPHHIVNIPNIAVCKLERGRPASDSILGRPPSAAEQKGIGSFGPGTRDSASAHRALAQVSACSCYRPTPPGVGRGLVASA